MTISVQCFIRRIVSVSYNLLSANFILSTLFQNCLQRGNRSFLLPGLPACPAQFLSKLQELHQFLKALFDRQPQVFPKQRSVNVFFVKLDHWIRFNIAIAFIVFIHFIRVAALYIFLR